MKPPGAGRLFFLDWLRIIAFAVLVIYHVGMIYVSWRFHVKSPFASHAPEPWMKLSEPWRMSLIFMVSGAALAHLLGRGASLGALRQRTRFLLFPLLCGVVLIVPPQSYVEVVRNFGYTGNYLDFLELYFTRFQGFCDSSRCLVLPTWNHLWFLPYLWAYTVLLFLIVAFKPDALSRLSHIAHLVLKGPGLLALPIAFIFTTRVLLVQRFPQTYAFIDDGFAHAIYLSMFMAGAVFASGSPMWPRLAALRWPALGLATGAWAALVGLRPGGLIEHTVVATLQWGALVAAFGFAGRHLNVDHPLRATLVEAVFPVFLLHQTVIIVADQWLLPLRWRPAFEAPVLILTTFTLCYGGYLLLRRIVWLRRWFGMKGVRSAIPTDPASFRSEKTR